MLDRAQFVGRPGWHELRAGLRPPPPNSSEPGGWQYHGSSSLEKPFQGGSGVCSLVPRRPSSPEVTLGTRFQFRCSVFFPQGWCTGRNRNSCELLFWRDSDFPLDITDARCECNMLDVSGGIVQHASAQADCGHGQEGQREPWAGCAERPRPLRDGTPNCAI